MNYIKLYGTYYNVDHYRMISSSSKMAQHTHAGKYFPCVYFYKLDGDSNCATDHSNPFDSESAAKKSAEISLEQAFKQIQETFGV